MQEKPFHRCIYFLFYISILYSYWFIDNYDVEVQKQPPKLISFIQNNHLTWLTKIKLRK